MGADESHLNRSRYALDPWSWSHIWRCHIRVDVERQAWLLSVRRQKNRREKERLRSENKIGRIEGFLRTHMTLLEHPIGVYNWLSSCFTISTCFVYWLMAFKRLNLCFSCRIRRTLSTMLWRCSRNLLRRSWLRDRLLDARWTFEIWTLMDPSFNFFFFQVCINIGLWVKTTNYLNPVVFDLTLHINK